MIHGQYFTDKDDVVSPFVEERGATLQARRTPGQQWDFACPLFEGEPGEFVCSARSEAVSELFLVRGENMDCPVLSRLESTATACRLGQTPQNHRWIERNGVEAVGGEANRGAIGRARRDDGHPRGKRTEYSSQLFRVELGHIPRVHS